MNRPGTLLSRAYTLLAAVFYISWSIFTAGLMTLAAANTGKKISWVRATGTAATASLLNFLVCQLLMLFRPASKLKRIRGDGLGDSLIVLLASIDGDYSRPSDAWVRLAFCAFWVYTLFPIALVTGALTLVGGRFAHAMQSGEPIPWNTKVGPDLELVRLLALLKRELGVDAAELLRLVDPIAILWSLVFVWANLLSMTIYIFWKGLRAVAWLLKAWRTPSLVAPAVETALVEVAKTDPTTALLARQACAERLGVMPLPDSLVLDSCLLLRP